MKRLYDPVQLARLRSACNAAVDAHPGIRRRRHPLHSGKRRQYQANGIIAPLIGCGVLLAMRAGGISVELQVAWVTMILTLVQFSLAGELSEALYLSPDLRPLFLLPVSDANVFAWEWNKWLRRCVPGSLLTLALVGTLLITPSQVTGTALTAVAVALGAILFMLGMSPILTRMHRVPFGCIATLITTSMFVLVLLDERLKNGRLHHITDQAAFTLNRLLPFGWLGLAGQTLVHDMGSVISWMMVITLMSVAIFLPRLKSHLSEGYRLGDEHQDTIEEVEKEWDNQTASNRPQRGPTELIESIDAGELNQIPSLATKGWLDRLLIAWLSPREYALIHLIIRESPGISAGNRMGLILIGAASLIALGGMHWHFKHLIIVASLIVIVGLFILLPFNSFLAHMSYGGKSGTSYISSLAMIPVGISELIRLDLKIVVTQSLGALPTMLLVGPCGVWLSGKGDWLSTMGYGLLVWWTLLATRPVASTWAIASQCMRPSGKLGRRFAMSLMKLLVVLIHVVLLAVAAIALPGAAVWATATGALQLLLSLGYTLWFVHIYNHGWLSPETPAFQEPDEMAN